jgi:hypothetical protein
MTVVPIGTDTYQRRRASEPDIRYLNRFYEADPTDQVGGVASIRRPGLYPRIEVGNGPIRKLAWQSGFAGDDLFIVSATELYRLSSSFDKGDLLTLVPGGVEGEAPPSMVMDKNHLFIADGSTLQYTDGTAALQQIAMPDDVAPISLAIVDEFVFISIEQDLTTGHQGDQFYWLNPGELTLDPLNFATAESSPDVIEKLMGIGDQLVILGADSTEFWYGTGATDLPFSPIQGRPYSRGVWTGTGQRVNDVLIAVGYDGRVYEISEAASPISSPGIEERIRTAMQIQQIDMGN